jgi:hypothetical protein
MRIDNNGAGPAKQIPVVVTRDPATQGFAGVAVLGRRSRLTAEVRLLTKAVGEGGKPGDDGGL